MTKNSHAHRVRRAASISSLAVLSTMAVTQAHAAPSYQLSTLNSTVQSPVMNAAGTIAGISQGQIVVESNGGPSEDLPEWIRALSSGHQAWVVTTRSLAAL